MTRKKTSIMVEGELWKKFLIFTIEKTGSSRKVSELVEEALKEYVSRHKA